MPETTMSQSGRAESSGPAIEIPESEWDWFGFAGHFICGSWCRFHLCTRVGAVLISTVGAYVHPRHSAGSERLEAKWLEANWPGEDIGYGRKFETGAFLAGEPCDAEGCNCGQPGLADAAELEMLGANDPKMARTNHLRLCHKYAAEQPIKKEQAMEWKLDEPTPTPRLRASHGPLSISVGLASNGQTWQYVELVDGRHSPKSPEQCRETWPREAIALARQALDKFEETLNAEETK